MKMIYCILFYLILFSHSLLSLSPSKIRVLLQLIFHRMSLLWDFPRSPSDCHTVLASLPVAHTFPGGPAELGPSQMADVDGVVAAF